jgi:hypothetical protein
MPDLKHLTLYTENCPGQMVLTPSVRCGVCSNWEDIQDAVQRSGALRAAARILKEQGWVLSKRLGWVCVHCVTGERRAWHPSDGL